MCVSCRERSAKRVLTRIVRTPAGMVEIDPTGKLNGRGAYLCDQRQCWERALATGNLARALNIEIPAEASVTLRDFAATRPERAAEEPVSTTGQEGQTTDG